MIESVLHRQLAPIVARLEAVRRRRSRTIVLAVVAGCAVFGILAAREAQESSPVWLWLPVIGGLLTILILKAASRRPVINLRKVALEIEAENPELKALLVTAVEEEEKAGGATLGYLQERLVLEAASKAISARWRERMAGGEARGWQLGQILAAVAMVIACGVLLVESIPTNSPEIVTSDAEAGDGTAAALSDDWILEVTPGNVELERGSKLVVTASFKGGRVPTTAQLDSTLGESVRRIAMVQNLSDPLFVASISDVSADGTYRISFASQESPEFKISTFVLPQVESVDVEIEQPPGSASPTKTIVDTRRITVLEGSTVRLLVRTNVPIKSGSLKSQESELTGLLTPDPNDETLATVELAPSESTKLRIHLEDADGRKNRKPPLFSIKVKRNNPPKIELAFPGGDTEVSPLQEIPVEAMVWDDVKITGAGMTFSFGSTNREIDFETAEFKPDKKNLVSTVLDFEELGAQPNELLTFFFWAEDVAANGETRRVTSDLRFAEVRHFEEIFREGMAGEDGQSQQSQQQGQQGQQGNQSEELIKQQKDVLNATWKLKRLVEKKPDLLFEDAPVVEAGQRAVIEAAGAAAQLVGDSEAGQHLGEAVRAMEAGAAELGGISSEEDARRLDVALGHEQEAYAALLKMRAREFEVQRAQQQSASASSSASQRQQRQMMNMELKQEEKRYETQRFAEEQQQEARREATREDMQMLNRLKELARRQGGITEKIQELQAMLEESKTEEEKEEIRRELERLEEEQRQLVEDLDELNERMESETNRDRTTEAREQLEDAREQAQKAAEALENQRLDQAINAGTRAEREFDELADDFRERTSNKFADEMRQARQEASRTGGKAGRDRG